jgi:hypothetical protein
LHCGLSSVSVSLKELALALTHPAWPSSSASTDARTLTARSPPWTSRSGSEPCGRCIVRTSKPAVPLVDPPCSA